MKTKFYLFAYFFVGLFFLTAATQTSCEKIFEPIAETIRKADADAFSAFFSEAVECDIMGVEQIYSKDQAKQIISNLFQSFGGVKHFTIRHCSGKESLKYAIGNITTAAGVHYRMTMFVNVDNNKTIVRQLRVEKQQ